MTQAGATAVLAAQAFAGMVDGRPVGLYGLRNRHGVQAAVCNWGARLLQWRLPGREGDLVLGVQSLEALRCAPASLGAFIAPYAGRIAQARFALHGQIYRLTANDGAHCLHGGVHGSRHQVFAVQSHSAQELVLALHLPTADTGFPGALDVQLAYRLEDSGALTLSYAVQCTGAPTPVSCTPHPFFHLDQGGAPTIDGHWVQVLADETLARDAQGVAHGARCAVAGTALDLRAPRLLARVGAVDDAFVLRNPPAAAMRLCARLGCEATARVLEVWSTEPVLQLYSADPLGAPFFPRAGVCLEPQAYPNAPNVDTFPLALAAPGRPVRGQTRYVVVAQTGSTGVLQ